MYKISHIIEYITINLMLILTLTIFALAKTVFTNIYSNYDLTISTNIITSKEG